LNNLDRLIELQFKSDEIWLDDGQR